MRPGASGSPTPPCRCSRPTATSTVSAGPGCCAASSPGTRARRRAPTRPGRGRRERRRAGGQRELFEVIGWRATGGRARPDPGRRGDPPLRGVPRARPCEPDRHRVDAQPAGAAARDEGRVRGSPRRLLEQASAMLRELGGLGAGVSHLEASVRLLAGQPALAEAPLRADVETLSAMSELSALATTTALLAQAVYAQGRTDEARELCRDDRPPRRAGGHRDAGDLARRGGEDPRPRRPSRRGRGARARGGRARRADRLALASRRCDARPRRRAPDLRARG